MAWTGLGARSSPPNGAGSSMYHVCFPEVTSVNVPSTCRAPAETTALVFIPQHAPLLFPHCIIGSIKLVVPIIQVAGKFVNTLRLVFSWCKWHINPTPFYAVCRFALLRHGKRHKKTAVPKSAEYGGRTAKILVKYTKKLFCGACFIHGGMAKGGIFFSSGKARNGGNALCMANFLTPPVRVSGK